MLKQHVGDRNAGPGLAVTTFFGISLRAVRSTATMSLPSRAHCTI
jgi:hypothetical protein